MTIPYLFAPKAKGRRYYYYRRAGQRIPIEDAQGRRLAPDDPGFLAAWQAIHDTFEDTAPTAPGAGTLAHVIETYRESPDYLQLAAKTRRDYARYLDTLKSDHGHLPVRTMPKEFILGLRDRWAAKPRTANYLVAVLRLVLSYAEDRPRTFALPNGWANPARKPKMLKTGAGHRPWEEHEIAAYRARWGKATVQRMAFELLLNTGQRGGDVAAMTRHHARRDGLVWVVQEKTGERIEIPASKDLLAVLRPWLKRHRQMVLLTTEAGRSLGIDAFRHMMRDAYDAAGLPTDCTTHGLRYTAGTILRELDCDWETIGDVLGHRTAEMVRKYTEKKRRTRVAITRLDQARKARKKNDPGA